MKDYLIYAVNNLRSRKLRTGLTVLGIIIGVAAVVALISIGQGLQNTVLEQFEQLGGDKIIVSPKGSYFGTGQPVSDAELTKDDVDVVRRSRGVQDAGGLLFRLSEVNYRDEQASLFISGFPQDETKEIFTSIQSIKIAQGRDLKKNDRSAALIGKLVAEDDLMGKGMQIRSKFEIEGQRFQVVGILETFGNPADDSQIIIPLESARDLFNQPEKVDFLMAQVNKGFNPTEVALDIERNLRSFRNVEEDKEDFEVQTFEQIQETFNDVLIVIQAILIGIAAISLLVGGIGIMNTMYTAVLARTQEIGLLKAIGAQRKDILTIFLLESGLLGLGGGLLGLALGASWGFLVELAAQSVGITFKAALGPELIIGSLLFSFIVGGLAGIAPAISATKLSPVEALRYE
jgi:putative ABC transport system permease protein